MAIPNQNELTFYTNVPITNQDFTNNFVVVIDWLTNGTYSLTVGTLDVATVTISGTVTVSGIMIINGTLTKTPLVTSTVKAADSTGFSIVDSSDNVLVRVEDTTGNVGFFPATTAAYDLTVNGAVNASVKLKEDGYDLLPTGVIAFWPLYTAVGYIVTSSNKYIDCTISPASTDLVIDATNDMIDFVVDTAPYTATITHGTYKRGSWGVPNTIGTAIRGAMYTATGGFYNFPVTYDAGTQKLTITTTASTFTIRWNSGAHTATCVGPIIGFPTSADSTGATTYTGNAITYSRTSFSVEVAAGTWSLGANQTVAGSLCYAVYNAIAAQDSGGTYTVSLDTITHKFTLTKSTGSFELLWKTGTNTANCMATLLGFSKSADSTGAITYTSPNAAIPTNTPIVPQGWALCDGTSGTPDLSGRFLVGYKSGDSDFGTIEGTGGEKTHTLITDEIASHTHTTHTYEGSGTAPLHIIAPDTTDYDTYTTGSTGSDDAHENRPPYYVLAYLMKT